MPIFTYKGIDTKGDTVSGQLEATDRKQAVRKLGLQKIRPTSITMEDQPERELDAESYDFFREESDTPRFKFLQRKQSKKQIALSFLKKVQVLLRSGMPIGDTIKLLSVRLTDPELKELCNTIWRKLSEGRTLASAMGDMPDLFNDSSRYLVEAGEASGNLVPVLDRIVTQMEETAALRKEIKTGMAYPFLVVGLAVGVVLFFLFFLLPILQNMLENLGGDLPFFTQMLIISSEFLLKYGLFIILGLVFVGFSLAQWRKKPVGRRMTDYWQLRLPFAGSVYLYSTIYSTSSLMATLMESGVNTTETLRLVERTIPNVILKAKFAFCRKQIQEGVSMATAFRRVKFMPAMAMDILTVGENTGNIVSSLHDINRIYRDEVKRLLRFMTGAISTGALAFAFLFVAVIAASTLLSIISVAKSIQT